MDRANFQFDLELNGDPDGPAKITPLPDSLGYWVDRYLETAKAKKLPVGHTLAPRTITDYEKGAERVKAAPLGAMLPLMIVGAPSAISAYRDSCVVDGKGKVQANHDLSLISGTFRWMIDIGAQDGLCVNPAKTIQRFSLDPKDRYVEDDEFRPVYRIAQRSVAMGMELAYRTLQRPGDLLRLEPSALRTKSVAGKSRSVLSVHQNKTGRTVDIEVDEGLGRALRMLTSDLQPIGSVVGCDPSTNTAPTLIHTTAGEPYTETGFGAMLRRYCRKAQVATFGLMDVRAKGATDMYLHGTPLEVIQMLMGHESIQTTEIYIKRLMRTISVAQPNALPLIS